MKEYPHEKVLVRFIEEGKPIPVENCKYIQMQKSMVFTIQRASTFLETDFPQPCSNSAKVGALWEIEIKTINDLQALLKEVGSIVIEPGDEKDEKGHIIIYDDYIE